MKLAIFSDIHGNINALEVVLNDISKQGADTLICLGDVVNFGADSHAVIQRLKGLSCTFIMGNHDSYIINPDLLKDYASSAPLQELIEQTRRQLTVDDFDFLRQFKPSHTMPLDGSHALCCFHGTPTSNTGELLPTASVDELDQLLSGYEATLFACGHTHIQFYRRVRDAYLLNPGSVGFSFAEYPFQGSPHIRPWAEYALVTTSLDGVAIEFRQLSL